MKTELTAKDKLFARERALMLSRDLNPNTYHGGNSNLAAYQGTNIVPSLTKVLKDADEIFNWLTA